MSKLTSDLVLVDTCAWIEFLRGKTTELGDHVEQLITSNSAMMCGVVVAELRQGLKNPDSKADAAKLDLLLDYIPCAATLASDWVAAGDLSAQLRGRGITVPLTDALIAVIAKRCGLKILTVDAHFKHLGY